jgi:hypothetical protein
MSLGSALICLARQAEPRLGVGGDGGEVETGEDPRAKMGRREHMRLHVARRDAT